MSKMTAGVCMNKPSTANALHAMQIVVWYTSYYSGVLIRLDLASFCGATPWFNVLN